MVVKAEEKSGLVLHIERNKRLMQNWLDDIIPNVDVPVGKSGPWEIVRFTIGDSAAKMFEDAPQVKERGHIGAHLRLMNTAAVREVGGWAKEKRPSRNHEEKWICGRLRKAGYKVGYSRDVRAIHFFGDNELGEDDWGYTEGTYHEGHREVWPPVNRFGWERLDVDWETCQ